LKTTIHNLRRYQDVIVQIRQLIHALSSYPESVEQLARELKQTRIAHERMTEDLDQGRKQLANKETYLKLCRENLEKYEHDLMEVTNQKEYSAVLKEIDTTKREIQDTESAILTLMDTVKKLEQELEGLTSRVETLEKEYSEAVASFEETNKEKVREKEALEKEKKLLEKQIPAATMRKFVQIATRRQGVAVATIVNECCTACNMKIRPQQIHEMKQNPETLYTCDNCQRILVVELDEDGS